MNNRDCLYFGKSACIVWHLREKTAMPGKESTPPFQSKLTPYRNEILKAWFRRQTLKEIQAMLQKHGVTISLPGISLFIKRHKSKYDPKAEPQKKRTQSAKASRSSEKLNARLQALEKVLVRDSSEVAREYDQKRSQQKSTHKFTETK